jgi:hypothetical protein
LYDLVFDGLFVDKPFAEMWVVETIKEKALERFVRIERFV